MSFRLSRLRWSELRALTVSSPSSHSSTAVRLSAATRSSTHAASGLFVAALSFALAAAALTAHAQDAGVPPGRDAGTRDAGAPRADLGISGSGSTSGAVGVGATAGGSEDVEVDAEAAEVVYEGVYEGDLGAVDTSSREPSLIAPTAAEVAAAEMTTTPPPPPPAPASLPSTDSNREEVGTDTKIPLRLGLHGYYRARYMWLGNVPGDLNPDSVGGGFRETNKAHYAFQRLRLLPEVTYGGDENNPIAALYMQFDGLDNVVFGDNARIAPAPLFAGDPSTTDIEGFEVRDSIRLERVWMQFLIPVGQIRLGRMPSQWGMGLLVHDGNGLGEWGDPQFGSTYDRVLFATRPLSIFNAIANGDSRPTPLVLAVGYDKLVEDPLTRSTTSPWPGSASWGAFGPYGTQPATRSQLPFAYLTNEDNDVNEVFGALAWADENFGPKPTDELTAGAYYVYRWQNRGGRISDPLPDKPTSRVHILDFYYKVDRSLGRRLPSIYSEAELLWITGRSNTVPISGPCVEDPNAPDYGTCPDAEANVWGGAFRAGVRQHGFWGALIELGFSSGDPSLFGPDLTARALHPDHHVGLLMYQVALQSAVARGMTEAVRPLWTRGGVYNSWYLFPQVRMTIIPGFEIHGAFLASFARDLLANVHQNDRADSGTDCGAFDGDCFMGWEADLALRVKWGENDLLRWDTEVGLMHTGKALHDANGSILPGSEASPIVTDGGFGSPWLWTIQSRMGLVF